MVQIIAVPPDMLDQAWPDAEPLIQKAIDKTSGEMLTKDVYNYVKTDKYILLMAFDKYPLGAVTLEIIDFPQKRKIGIVHVGGYELKRWFEDMWEAIKSIAKEYNADSISWIGRFGWERMMKNEINHSYTMCEAEL